MTTIVDCIGDEWRLEAERRAVFRLEAAKRVTVTRADGVMEVRVDSAVAWRCKAGNERKVSAGARRAANLAREKAIEADPTAFDGEIAETMTAWSRWTATTGTAAVDVLDQDRCPRTKYWTNWCRKQTAT